MKIEQPGAINQHVIAPVKPAEGGLTRNAAQTSSAHAPEMLPGTLQAEQEMIREIASAAGSTLEFSVDTESGRIVVKIMDTATRELIRQIPMEEMLALAKAMDQLQGLLLQTKA